MKWIMPETTDWAREQNLHEPTRSYGEEIYTLVAKHPYKNALEIGCAWGVSTLAILMAGGGRLTSVDSNPKTHAMEEVPANGYQDRWDFIHADSEEFWKHKSEVSKDNYDLVYIDGSHKYPKCWIDIEAGWQNLAKGGILIADDFVHPKNQAVDKDGTTVEYGVSYAVCRLIQQFGIKKIDSTTRLLVAYK